MDLRNPFAEVMTFDEERQTGDVGARLGDDQRGFWLLGVHDHGCDEHRSDSQDPEAIASHRILRGSSLAMRANARP
jgi:hypothetical protein